MERLSVSLTSKSLDIIQKYQEKYNTSQADIIRKGLNCLETMENALEKTSMENILAYIDYLSDGEHLILDISSWKSIFCELEKASKKFWEEVYNEGDFHRQQYSDKGIKDVKKILTFIEKTNWYRLQENGKESFTLVLAVSESSKFIKTFFEGFFSKFPQKVDVTEEYMKIRISIKQH